MQLSATSIDSAWMQLLSCVSLSVWRRLADTTEGGRQRQPRLIFPQPFVPFLFFSKKETCKRHSNLRNVTQELLNLENLALKRTKRKV
eukprot:4038564-Amphidinium_carterae.1